MEQLDLFAAVSRAYHQSPDGISMPRLYQRVSDLLGLDEEAMAQREPVGRARAPVNLVKRAIRWHQQTLKHAGVIEPTDERGVWRLTQQARAGQPREIQAGVFVLGFSTKLGAAVIADCRAFFSKINEPIHLVFTSPPYPLARARAYGNVGEQEYVDWLCYTIEPVIRLMAPGASLCLNLGNDVFMPGSPARSLYQERLMLALHDRFGLQKMDGLVWTSNKAPGPCQWASRKRMQLNTGYEMLWWLTNDPQQVLSNNQRVLQPHTEQHLSFVRAGGHKSRSRHCDGAHIKRVGAYANETAGRIPRNVLNFHRSRSDMDREYRAYCQAHGYVRHGASMPVSLAKFCIEFMTERGHLVVDCLAGRLKTALAAESLGRRWLCTDKMADYVLGSRAQFPAAALEFQP